MCTSVGCQSPLYGDCRQPEKVVKGIYITFCTPPRLHAEIFDSILSHYRMKIVLMYFDSTVYGNKGNEVNGNVEYEMHSKPRLGNKLTIKDAKVRSPRIVFLALSKCFQICAV